MPGVLRPLGSPPLDPFVFDRRAKISIAAMLLLEAMDGWEAGLSLEKHRELSQFLSDSQLGVALVAATLSARERFKDWPGFCVSLRLPGFVEALLAWCAIIPVRKPGIAVDAARLRATAGEDSDADAYFLRALLDEIRSEGIEGMDEAVKGWSRAINAQSSKARRRSNGASMKLDVIRDAVSRWWISGALWCRDRSGILCHIWPTTGTEPDLKRITDSISKLGLSGVHRGEHGAEIERAEKSFWSRLEK
jgi:hypothetical protein